MLRLTTSRSMYHLSSSKSVEIAFWQFKLLCCVHVLSILLSIKLPVFVPTSWSNWTHIISDGLSGWCSFTTLTMLPLSVLMFIAMCSFKASWHQWHYHQPLNFVELLCSVWFPSLNLFTFPFPCSKVLFPQIESMNTTFCIVKILKNLPLLRTVTKQYEFWTTKLKS